MSIGIIDNLIEFPRNVARNDRGGLTYIPMQCVIQDERRMQSLADVRVLADATIELCRVLKEFWPLPEPLPVDVAHVLNFADYAIARVRIGTLKNIGIHADE